MKKLTDSQIRFIDKLVPGQRASGIVTGFADFGAFVSIGMVSGLLHNRNIKWGRIDDPKHYLRLKQKIEVVILEVDKEQHATALLRKEFGWVMEVVPGIEGLLHNTELANHPQPVVEGDAFELVIRKMENDTRKLYLGF